MRCLLLLFSVLGYCGTLFSSNSVTHKGYYLRTKTKPSLRPLRLYLHRFYNKNKVPVVLTHAMTLSHGAMHNLALLLWRHGFDVWLVNMRGHGLGAQRSEVSSPLANDYAFEHIASEDYPKIVRFIKNKTQQRVHIIGHSMGAATWEQYLSGVSVDKFGSIYQSLELAKKRAQKDIKSFVAIASPANFKGVCNSVKSIFRPLYKLLYHYSGFIPFNVNLAPNSLQRRNSWSVWWRKKILTWIMPLLPKLFPCGIIANKRTTNQQQLNTVIMDNLSSPHSDYSADIVNWFDQPFMSRNCAVDFANNKHVFVPTLMLTTSEDRLVPASEVETGSSKYPDTTWVKIINIKGFGHLDIIFDDALKLYQEELVRFLRSH